MRIVFDDLDDSELPKSITKHHRTLAMRIRWCKGLYKRMQYIAAQDMACILRAICVFFRLAAFLWMAPLAAALSTTCIALTMSS